MKRTLIVFVALLIGVLNAFAAGVRYDAKTWSAVQTYDVTTLSKSLASHMRELVGVRFYFRGKDIHHMKPNWYESSVWQTSPEKKGKVADVRVMVSKADLSAFKSIPTEAASPAPELVLYGRVERDAEANFLFIRLVGRNATVDSSGNATVGW